MNNFNEVKQNKVIVLKGLLWSLIDQFGIYFVKLVFGIVIARLLTPDDYGLVGIIVIFIAIGTQITDSGFQMALIQKKNADKSDFNTVFVFNVIISLVIYVVLYFSAGYISKLYNQPILVNIIRVAALNVVIGALSGIQLVVLTKNLNFKSQAKINFISAFISGCVGVILAYNGFNFWALIAQTLAGTVCRTILLWYKAHWIPSFYFSWISFKTLFSFGSKIFGQGLMDSFFSNIYNPLIGKFYSVGDLGYYAKAKSFTDLYTVQISLAVGKVAFPSLSNINSDSERQKKTYLGSLNVLIIFFFAATLILRPLIEPVILFALTKKWIFIIPLMKLLIFEALFYPLYRFNMIFIESQGKSGTSFILDVFKKIITIISLIFTLSKGIEAIVCGILISSAISLFITWIYLASYINLKQQIKLYFINTFIAVLTLCVFHYTNKVINNALLCIILNSTLPLIVFYLLIRLSGFEPFLYTRNFIFDVLKERRNS